MLDLSKEKIDFDCPECGRQNRVSLAQVASQSTISCSGCSQLITLQDKNGSTRKAVTDINQSFKDLENAFKRLGAK